MTRFLLRRVLSSVLLLVVISALTYWSIRLIPGDQARTILGITASQEQVDAKRHELGLDQPVLGSYLQWLGHAVRGDLGTSWFTQEPISSALMNRLPATMSITLGATLVSGVLGITFGMVAAARRGAVDRTLQLGSALGFAVPNFLVALYLVVVFAVRLGWFPATGFVPFAESPRGWLESIALPVAALSVGATAAVAQQTRNAAAAVLATDYVRTLRSRGLPQWRLYLQHVLRNSSSAALTMLSLQFIGLLGGAVIIEHVFALPGLGSYAVGVSTQKDLPAVQGLVVVMVAIVVIVNLLVDVAQGWINPKLRRA